MRKSKFELLRYVCNWPMLIQIKKGLLKMSLKAALTVFLLLVFTNKAFSYPDVCKGRESEFQDKISTFTQVELSGKTVFSGSSSILMWKKTHTYFESLYKNIVKQNYYNRGFGGSQICHLLINYKKIFLGKNKRQHPERIVLYSGDNDLANNLTPKQIVEHYRLLLTNLRNAKVKAPIYLITVKPSPKRMYMIDLIQEVGVLMKLELEKLKNVYVIHPFSEFFDEKGELKKHYFLADELHLKPVVYKMWAKKIEELWSTK